MSDYFDRQGQPINYAQFAGLMHVDPEYKFVARDNLDGVCEVSTVWLGLDHNWGGGEPIIFETMIFGGKYSNEQWRYMTEAEALDGHRRIVAALVRMQDPNDAVTMTDEQIARLVGPSEVDR